MEGVLKAPSFHGTTAHGGIAVLPVVRHINVNIDISKKEKAIYRITMLISQ